MMIPRLFVCSVFLSLLFGCTKTERNEDKPPVYDTDSTALPLKTDSASVLSVGKMTGMTDAHIRAALSVYYRKDFATVWVDKNGWNSAASYAVSMFSGYLNDGIADSSLFLDHMKSVYSEITNSDTSASVKKLLSDKNDILFTYQFILFATQIWESSAATTDWFIPKKEIDDSILLMRFINTRPPDFLASLPVNPQFELLRKKLILLNSIDKKRSWRTIPLITDTIIPGKHFENIAAIKNNLRLIGLYSHSDTTDFYNQALEKAIRSARISYGLNNENFIDSSLIAELNVAPAIRIHTIMINMERYKWLPFMKQQTYIQINVPSFNLKFIQDEKVKKDMRVIVGTEFNPTPVFYGTLQSMIIHPYWNIPEKIVINEIIPSIKKDRHYLSKHHMEIKGKRGLIDPSAIRWSRYPKMKFPYNIRQRPGPDNALGEIKFVLPNSYGIYLHDTPSRYLFSEDQRAFSHGCIRIHEPKWLAYMLLEKDKEWLRDRIDLAFQNEQTIQIKIPNPTPVLITYFTSWVDDEGLLHFRKDLYGHDARLAALLFK